MVGAIDWLLFERIKNKASNKHYGEVFYKEVQLHRHTLKAGVAAEWWRLSGTPWTMHGSDPPGAAILIC